MGRVARGGVVHRLYLSLSDDERHALLDVIGVKTWQRMGHRHRVPALRNVTSPEGWTVVDAWLADPAGEGGGRAVGDLFDGLLRPLVERSRELLGDHADEPSVDDLRALAETLSAERSEAQARLLLAAVVDLEFAATPHALELAAAEPRFALPALD
jgi:hypothetical protein